MRSSTLALLTALFVLLALPANAQPEAVALDLVADGFTHPLALGGDDPDLPGLIDDEEAAAVVGRLGEGDRLGAPFLDVANGLLESVRDNVRGACGFCANSHGTKDAIEAADYPLPTDYKGHASLRALVQDGYQIINY